MNENIEYPNKLLGKNGWFYWFIFPLLAGPIIIISIFIFSIINHGYDDFAKGLMFLGALYFSYYLLLGIQILVLGAKTAKQICAKNGYLLFTTYSGKKIIVEDISKVKNISNKHTFTKKHHALLYPTGCYLYILVVKDNKYYLPTLNKITDIDIS